MRTPSKTAINNYHMKDMEKNSEKKFTTDTKLVSKILNMEKDLESNINYLQTEPNSHFWTSLDMLQNALLMEDTYETKGGREDYKNLVGYLRKGIENTQNHGYYLAKYQSEPGPETNPLLIDMQETFSKCLDLVRRKNADYSGKEELDPYKNIKNSLSIGVRPEQGVLVRMMDKMSRISNLLKQDAEVKTESIEDTLDDLINYTAILKSYLKRVRDSKQEGIEKYDMLKNK